MTAEAAGVAAGKPVASLLQRLAKALDARSVPYCQWKGLWTAHRWAGGWGDVDLLVDHEARAEFRQLVADLGFKPALPPGERQIPGVESYFGHDPSVPRLLHLHVHYRLVLGDFWRVTYRIPIERAMLETAEAGTIFRVPDPTYQFVVFVLRMVLSQRGRPLLSIETRWRRNIQIQLDNLEGLTERETLAAVLSRHLAVIDLPFFDRCVASLRGQRGPLERVLLPDQLHSRLRAFARRPPLAALLTAAADKILPLALRRRLSDERMRFAGGGTTIALVGGDGAGKSTCTRLLGEWLSPHFTMMCAHLGLPPRSLLTLLVGGALKAEQMLNGLRASEARGASHLELLRHLCTARDCFRLYERVRRFTARGGAAICERYPVSQLRSHVGPRIPPLLSSKPTPLARLLGSAEESYYKRILPPDALFVLRLDPNLAVLRKPDESAEYVRARGGVVWETDWTGTTARVVDVDRPLNEVLQQLKSLVWSVL
jgi:thymidylate kinase